MMKSLGLFSVIKFVLMFSLLLLCLNATLSLYTSLSIRAPLIFTFTSSSNHSRNTSSPFNVNIFEKTSSLPPATMNHPPNFNYSVSPPSVFTPSSSSSSSLINSSTSVQNSGMRSAASCDLSKGEWIKDQHAPYYSNKTCGTIQEHQNCMKYGRPDMDFLRWRWKPDDCELPPLDPVKFLAAMRGKNLAFVGDSLARNQMQSLMCLLSKDASVQPSLVIVYFGGNDSIEPYPSGLGSHVPLPEYKENMRRIATHVKNLSEKTRAIFLSCPPLNEESLRKSTSSLLSEIVRTNETCRLYSEACKEVCQEMNLKVIDLWTAIQQRDDWDEVCFTDGLHFSSEGSKIVVEQILKVIKEADWSPSLYWKSMPTEFAEDSPYDLVAADGISTFNPSDWTFHRAILWD